MGILKIDLCSFKQSFHRSENLISVSDRGGSKFPTAVIALKMQFTSMILFVEGQLLVKLLIYIKNWLEFETLEG